MPARGHIDRGSGRVDASVMMAALTSCHDDHGRAAVTRQNGGRARARGAHCDAVCVAGRRVLWCAARALVRGAHRPARRDADAAVRLCGGGDRAPGAARAATHDADAVRRLFGVHTAFRERFATDAHLNTVRHAPWTRRTGGGRRRRQRSPLNTIDPLAAARAEALADSLAQRHAAPPCQARDRRALPLHGPGHARSRVLPRGVHHPRR